MSILKKCNTCKRVNGYAEHGGDTVCARCKRASKKQPKNNEGTTN